MPKSTSGKDSSRDLDTIIEQNVALVKQIEAASTERRTTSQVMSDAIAAFCGSTAFIWAHCGWFGFWLIWNTLPAVPRHLKFDQPPYSILTLIVSLEAIFLSTFILISQNRQQRVSDERTHLDLQINMLAEQESSHMLAILMEIRTHLGVSSPAPLDIEAAALGEVTDVKKVIEHLQEGQGPRPKE